MAKTYTAAELKAKFAEAQAAEKAALPALQDAQIKQNQAQAAADAARSSVSTPPLPYSLKEITDARRAAANGDSTAKEKVEAQEAAVTKRSEITRDNPDIRVAEANLKDAKAEAYIAQEKVNLAQQNKTAAEFKTEALNPNSDAAVFTRENPSLAPEFIEAPARIRYADSGTMQQIAADKQVFDNANKGIGPNETAANGAASTSTAGASTNADGGFNVTQSDGTVDKFNSKGELVSTGDSSTSKDQSSIESNSDASIIGNMDSNDPFARAKAMSQANFDENGAPLNETITAGTGTNPVANVNLSSTGDPGWKVEVSGVNKKPGDWRVRLSLAPGADYLYRSSDLSYTDILFPLKDTDGVIFPYLPQINISYRANYAPVEITHTNYKNYFYTNSSLDDLTIIADFTAQDNVEAKYMLAVIHFFKSVTKMFYGQDINPRGGTPPPLCYLTGLGEYQFKNHPLVLTNFSYNLPNDVDYIRTETVDAFTAGGIPVRKQNTQQKKSNPFNDFLSKHRLAGSNLNKNAVPSGPNFKSLTSSEAEVTYVPTKIQIQLAAHPIVTREDISNNFKLNGKNSYSSGDLVKTRGIW